ncbi:TIR domain-containing protein [Paenibacillus glycanilyticus]|uniref:TIR domain-containing protein n=1 Tax=Paenibacillus glycanilyticus TaxID=126569 RepID=UPI003EBAD6CB
MNKSSPSYTLYLSCSWYYDNTYKELLALLDLIKEFRYEIRTLPVDITRSSRNKGRRRYQRIKNVMDNSDALLVLGGVYPLYQDLLGKEIMACKNNQSKPLIVIKREAERQISPVVSQYADRIVEWRAEDIIKTIRELIPGNA